MKTRIVSEFSFEVWINDQTDALSDENGPFDDNWIVSAGDLFGTLELPDENYNSLNQVA